MQVAFNGLLHWVIHLLMPTCIEFLNILGNFPPPTRLIAKQLIHEVAPLYVPTCSLAGHTTPYHAQLL